MEVKNNKMLFNSKKCLI